MKRRLPLAAAGLVLAGALAAVLFQPRTEAATPIENVGGAYSGKGVSVNRVIGAEEPGKGAFGAQFGVSQEGDYISATVTISPPDEESFQWELSGFAGNGNFWLSGVVGEGETVVLTGTAKGKPGSVVLKADGFFLSPTHYSDLKFSVKQLGL